MLSALRLLWNLLGRCIDLFVGSIIWISSNKSIFAGIVVITIWWYLFPSRFGDTAVVDYPKLVFWYTVIYGTWEGATKIAQAIQTRHDRHVQQLMQITLESTQVTTRSVEDLALDIRRELDHSRERDEAAVLRDEQAALRDSALIGLIKELLERIVPEDCHDQRIRVD